MVLCFIIFDIPIEKCYLKSKRIFGDTMLVIFLTPHCTPKLRLLSLRQKKIDMSCNRVCLAWRPVQWLLCLIFSSSCALSGCQVYATHLKMEHPYMRCSYFDYKAGYLGHYSLSGRTSYCKILWSLEAARLDVKIIASLWNLKFDRHLGSAVADVPVEFQSDWKSLNPNLVASRFHDILL